MSIAVRVLAQRSAIGIVKDQLRAKSLKVQHCKHRDIVAMANDYIVAHPELIADAKATVLRWQAEGVFGPRGGISQRRNGTGHILNLRPLLREAARFLNDHGIIEEGRRKCYATSTQTKCGVQSS
jgi:hypothetical protein